MNIYEVLRRPVITEKSNLMAEQRQYVFEVARDANKALVKEAVETRFGVTVQDVNLMRVRGKTRRFGRKITRTPWWKKAIVTVAPGQAIEVYEA